ncbi:tRNA pseudouridine(38-40) synthase TruA [Rhodoferax aquaticus]|uniref:tRNA pseudouridine synthase A n=1 Tax=Rhodoferax aquaticus TaxID=2527691 RepID=A0A515EVW9_9BURK|nr:tRNA pseudouridine(38-40) synthase TruA [Rhodoferax aquaticus]QDL56825.1 tRNA pseudouridine(38-40) synthase TruA [Rhodoferax aquaticus]
MRIALGISYNGQAYQGWQSQPSGLTVQDRLEAALSKFADQRIATLCAGRTDAGVHALMQVVHFDTDRIRDTHAWVRGTNANLVKNISVQWAVSTSDSFHCRASAISRRYAYVVLESPVRPSVDAGRVGWCYEPLDQTAMETAAKHLLGEQDFTSFRASQCQALSPVKTMVKIDISKRGAYWRFDFEANAFLHHMIRNIMGCLIQVGRTRRPAEWMLEVLHARDRRAAAPTFSPDGLYFLGPQYDPQWGMPNRTPAFDMLP